MGLSLMTGIEPFSHQWMIYYCNLLGTYSQGISYCAATIRDSAGHLDRATLPIALVVGTLLLRTNRVAVAGPYLWSVPAIKTHCC